VRARVEALLPEAGHVENPVDLDGAGESDLGIYVRVVRELLADERVDAVVLSGYFGCYGENTPELLEAELAEVEELGRAAMEHRKPLLVHSMSADSQAVADMWARAVPCYRSIDTTMRVLSRAAFYSSHAGRIAEAFELSGTVTPWGRGYS
ncbi:acid--CoA ligase, partial [Burkholderia multivorans]